MELLWTYFKEVLRLPFILRQGPLAMLLHGAAVALDAARDAIIQLRDQFVPGRCETVYLTRFARSRGIVRNPVEPDDHWEMRIRLAYLWWARGGRPSAMAETLKKGFLFSAVKIVNLGSETALYDETTSALLFDEDSGKFINNDHDDLRWAEFMVIIYLSGNETTYTMEQIIWAINEIKPGRSKLVEIMFISPLYDETSNAGLYDETSKTPLTS